MTESHTIKRLDQLRLLADPLRLHILEHLCFRPMTTKQVAGLLGEKPTRLYHHVEKLEEVGLIQLVETKKNRGTTEKYYRSIARSFRVDHQVLRPGPGSAVPDALLELVTVPLETTLTEIRRSVDCGLITGEEHSQATMTRARIRTTAKGLKALNERLGEWMAEFHAADREDGEHTYSLTVAFYPVADKGETT